MIFKISSEGQLKSLFSTDEFSMEDNGAETLITIKTPKGEPFNFATQAKIDYLHGLISTGKPIDLDATNYRSAHSQPGMFDETKLHHLPQYLMSRLAMSKRERVLPLVRRYPEAFNACVEGNEEGSQRQLFSALEDFVTPGIENQMAFLQVFYQQFFSCGKRDEALSHMSAVLACAKAGEWHKLYDLGPFSVNAATDALAAMNDTNPLMASLGGIL